ncbi:MAG TPA: cysteine--tRNA ligase [Parachlamydiaceae bacterium]|nr:cysteine--tRNA ligase [Parachlamydiaceae bacterium]
MTDRTMPISELPLSLFNTESRRKEILTPIRDNHIRMYTCGPTVYNFAHIGNFRTYVFEDVLRRTIKFFGMKITQVMNLTDVDDKTIKGAIAQDITLDEFTQPFKDAFFDDLKTLNIEPVEHYPAATDYIAEMIEMIHTLIDKGFAYKSTDGSIYFAISKFPRYGCLSHLKLEDLQSGASERVAADEYEKDNVSDFVLWKAYDPTRDGKIYWESPFGPGRPGWHLECSAMAIKILGETIDIHVGGIDNMFPHHENEIAQSEACSGHQFVKLWMHSEHLIVDNKKMSKSLGNFFTLRDLVNKGYSGIQVRYMLLQTHYKTQLNFTMTGLESVKVSLQRLQDFILRMGENNQLACSGLVDPVLDKAYEVFSTSLADDLNISAALAGVFDLLRVVNGLSDEGKVGKEEAEKVISLLKRFNEVLGVLSFEKAVEEIPADLEEALANRIEARQQKNWALADTLRDLIAGRGYIIEDTPQGARLKKGS